MTGGASILIAIVTLASATGAHDIEPRSAITRASIRRAIAPIATDQPIAAPTQSGADWRNVTGVKAGADTRVILDNWKTHRGKFHGADERSVTLEIGGVNRTLQRSEVREVAVRGGGRAGNAKAWAAVGMLGGLAAGVASCRGEEAECAQGRPLTGMMLGSLAGAIFGATRPTWSPIYGVRP